MHAEKAIHAQANKPAKQKNTAHARTHTRQTLAIPVRRLLLLLLLLLPLLLLLLPLLLLLLLLLLLPPPPPPLLLLPYYYQTATCFKILLLLFVKCIIQVSHNQNPVLKWLTQNHVRKHKGGRNYVLLGLSLTNRIILLLLLF